ncbi:helicase-exonuclease AddAB subunit AddA [Vagococcus humatus]|uniref:ATP-dependent helicase/nuclease subunit A n=1 Tax=Vagococcus humatus TaxID=1889241 RepID=A0A3S0A5T4_9ENTE|nr:helicase-exonuclease AddAB subunit AddA [Vagococcus humatus]RST89636.1 helicase-exonuclease AddAB subunit AddA [Vagococcus humatus]
MTTHIPVKPNNSLFTDSQWQAIYDSGDNLLISASAGSGKTMVLVHRVIEKIKQGTHLDELLIVTYTEAAAKEMKERIQKAIQEAISQETDRDTKQHFIEQIAKIPTANISTLHAFCLQVIRKYYYLIDIDPVFRLLTDETEMLLLEEDVWDELREELYASMQQPFYDLTENFSNDRTDRGLEQLIFTLHNFARSHPDPVAWLTGLSDLYEVPESQLLSDTKIYQEVLKKTLHSTVLSAANQGKLALSLVDGEEQLLKVKEMLQKEQHLMDNLLQYIETDQLDQAYEAVTGFEYDRFNGPRKNAKNEAYYDSLKDLFEQVKPLRNQNKETIQKLADTFFKAPPKKLLEIMAQSKDRVATLSLVSIEFYQRFKRRKKELNLVDFNDLEHFTLDILATSGEQGLEPSEASHYYREKFSEVLVDEYQDINQLQESLLYWLRTPEPEPGNLFMVGDVKQSIYSFRLADPSLFIAKYQKFGENQSGRRILLQENFRSRKEVLSFTNFVFTQLMDEAVGQIAYDQSAELVNGFTEFPESDQFQVEMLLYEKGAEVTEDVADLTIDFELDDKTEGETQLVGRKIQELVTSGYLIYDKKLKEQRPVRYKDIVLLTPTKKNNLVLLDQFNQLGIPLHVNDTQNYFQATEIQTMVSLLQIIDNPYQDIPFVSVLRSPIVGLKENDLGIIRLYEKEHDFYQAVLAYLKEAEPDQPRYQKLRRFHILFTDWRELARRNQLGQLIWRIYEDTGFLDFVAGLPAGKQRQANLHALYHRANAYEEMSFKGLFQFVRFIEKMQEKNKDLAEPTTMSEDEDAVRVMTIHASKGLEFPVVFVLDMSRQFNTQDLKTRYVLDDKLGAGIDYIDTAAREVYESLPKMALKVFKRQKLLAEEMRKLYVALTRAEQKLFLVGTVASQEKAWQRWCQVGEAHQRVLPEDIRLKCQNLLDWVGYTLVRHEIADNMQQEYPVIKLADLYHYPVSFQIKFYQPQDIAKLANSKENLDQSAVLLDRKDLDERLYQQAYKRLTYHYPYQLASQTTSYQSVSEIKRVFEDPDNVDLLSLDLQERQPRGKNRFTEEQLAVPKFLSQKKQVTAAEIGTATHLLLQQVPLDKTPDEQLFVTLAQQLIEQKIMSEEVVQHIDFSQLVAFFNSEFGQFMVEHHQHIVREQPFSMLMRPENLFQDYPENEQDDVLIHGIIDGYIQLPDQLILYDYKTDFVNPSNLSENLLTLKKRYQGQLYLYKQALEKATGKPVTSVRLILLQANQALEMLT